MKENKIIANNNGSKIDKNVIIANWKMNKSFDDSEEWLRSFKDKIDIANNLPEIVICPSSALIDCIDEVLLIDELEYLESRGKIIEELEEKEVERLTDQIRKIQLGGQDCSSEESGAFTGDVSAKMLVDAGCKYVILGHSERRQYYFESNQLVQKKIITALKNSLIPILCVGESIQDRQDGKYLNFIKQQIEDCIPKNVTISDFIIAYEPIWAIGSGKTPTKEEIAEVTDFIRDEVSKDSKILIKNLKVIYGGSTNSKNTEEILSIDSVQGLLVGGASLDESEFFQMSVLAAKS